MLKIKNIIKLGMIVIIQGNKEVLHIACVIQCIAYLKKKNHNGTNHDYHFIRKE